MDSRLLATIIIFPIWLTLVIFFRRHRQWLLYYMVAAFGLTIQIVFLAEHFGLDQILVNIASFHVNLISKYILHWPVEMLSGGRFQLALSGGGSSILKLGIECSAILESGIIVSLIIFYPLFNLKQKILRAVFGLVVTYVINIIRLMIIVFMAHKFGPDYIFLAHAGVARIFFFIFELLLYWYLMTKPSVKSVGDSIRDGVPLAKTARVGYSFKGRNAVLQVLTIVVIVGISALSFGLSDEWRKAFIKTSETARPLIYQDETGFEEDKNDNSLKPMDENVLGEKSKATYTSETLSGVKPQELKVYKFEAKKRERLNFQISEAGESSKLEIYINDNFQNRTYVSPVLSEDTNNRTVFEKALELAPGDIVELRLTNTGEKESDYIIKVVGNHHE